MALIDQIKFHRMKAAKEGDVAQRDFLGTLYAEAARVGKDARNDKSTDEDVVSTATKFMKALNEGINALESAGRGDEPMAHSLRKEMKYLARYLPKQMNEEELRNAIADTIKKVKAEGPKDMGKVMGVLKATHGATYDGSLAAGLVKEALLKASS